jgi:RNA:NAD 2'-phosphotransferase (TPT1/KptA family)
MQAQGGVFHVSNNGVWLTDAVPTRVLNVAEAFSRDG